MIFCLSAAIPTQDTERQMQAHIHSSLLAHMGGHRHRLVKKLSYGMNEASKITRLIIQLRQLSLTNVLDDRCVLLNWLCFYPPEL